MHLAIYQIHKVSKETGATNAESGGPIQRGFKYHACPHIDPKVIRSKAQLCTKQYCTMDPIPTVYQLQA